MRINDVVSDLLLKQPFYGYVAASITIMESEDIPEVSMDISPTLCLHYNKKWFEELSYQNALGVILHEILHIILLHPFRGIYREYHLWAIACDMAVNEHIDPILLTDTAVTVEKISDEIKYKLPKQKSAEFYYDIISKSNDAVSFADREKDIKVFLKDGRELKVNKSIDSDSSEMNKNAVKSMVSELVDQAKAEGEIPDGVYSLVDEVYYSSGINWRSVLNRFLFGRGRMVTQKTCKKESRRYENMPGNRRAISANVLLAIDESGSISDSQVTGFYNELMVIKKVTGASIRVTQFDTECTEPVPIEKFIRKKNRVKNGGTDFRPIFNLADKVRIPLVIVFTDGDGTAPAECGQKVLWVLTRGGKKPADFGYAITFNDTI